MIRFPRGWLRSLRGRLRLRLPVLGAAAVTASLVLTAWAVRAQQRADFRESPYLRIDPAKIQLSDRDSRVPCGECHGSEYEVWRRTKHAEGFETMHRKESATDILKNMGLTVTKRQESLCMRCHYTVGPQLRAIAGVSCESCHGPAQDWISVHNNWGDGIDHPDREAPEHKQQRIAQSTSGGMLRPSGNLYAVAANCFECHTVPIEELVNKGAHVTGSARFELVERATDIRHNYVQAQWGGEATNRAPTPERTRIMFAVGKILAYEYSVRGLAAATSEGRYFKAMERRTQQSYRELEDVARAVMAPQITQILEIGASLRLVPDQETALLAAAARIRTAGLQFATTADGARLAGLDPLVAGGAPPVAEESPPPAAPAAGTPGRQPDSAAATTGGASTGGAAATQPTTTAAPAAQPVPSLPGRIRNRPEWMPAPSSQYKTTLADCAKCHDEAQEWWEEDKHKASAARLVNKQPRAREIATLYGIEVDRMANGDVICMNCHGTARAASPAPVRVGVSCERCHGPSSEYLDPHEKGGNPQLGMTALKQPAVQATTCAGCHRITDERLLAASHPSGEAYDIVSATQSIRHWPDRRPDKARQKRGEAAYTGPAEPGLRSAFAQEASSRAIPQVTVAALPAGPTTTTAPSGGPQQPRTQTPQPSRPSLPAREISRKDEPATPSLPPSPAPVRPTPNTTVPAALEANPIPAVTDSLTSEDLLLLVKRRLDRLYALLARNRG